MTAMDRFECELPAGLEDLVAGAAHARLPHRHPRSDRAPRASGPPGPSQKGGSPWLTSPTGQHSSHALPLRRHRLALLIALLLARPSRLCRLRGDTRVAAAVRAGAERSRLAYIYAWRHLRRRPAHRDESHCPHHWPARWTSTHSPRPTGHVSRSFAEPGDRRPAARPRRRKADGNRRGSSRRGPITDDPDRVGAGQTLPGRHLHGRWQRLPCSMRDRQAPRRDDRRTRLTECPRPISPPDGGRCSSSAATKDDRGRRSRRRGLFLYDHGPSTTPGRSHAGRRPDHTNANGDFGTVLVPPDGSRIVFYCGCWPTDDILDSHVVRHEGRWHDASDPLGEAEPVRWYETRRRSGRPDGTRDRLQTQTASTQAERPPARSRSIGPAVDRRRHRSTVGRARLRTSDGAWFDYSPDGRLSSSIPETVGGLSPMATRRRRAQRPIDPAACRPHARLATATRHPTRSAWRSDAWRSCGAKSERPQGPIAATPWSFSDRRCEPFSATEDAIPFEHDHTGVPKPRRPWTSGTESSERGEAIMTPSQSSSRCPSRGWTRPPASSSGTRSSPTTRSRRH